MDLLHRVHHQMEKRTGEMTVSDAHYTLFLLFPGNRAEKNRIGIHCRRSRVFSWSS